MSCRLLAPETRIFDLGADLERLCAEPALPFFSDAALAFAGDFHRRLVADPAGRGPELSSLAFWLRPAQVKSWRERYGAGERRDATRVPVGTVFHVPPSNVDTLFVYGWVLSLLLGNRNLVRIPGRASQLVESLLVSIGESLRAVPELARRNAFLEYGHDDAVNRRLSSVCDLRIVWGGDATVEHFRSLGLPPLARELCFADRFSLSIVNAAAFATADAGLADLASRFRGDLVAYDQRACSSPRLVCWIGDPETRGHVSRRFFAALRSALPGYYEVGPDVAIAKKAFACEAAGRDEVLRIEEHCNELLVIELDGMPPLPLESPGAGTVFSVGLDDWPSLESHLDRRIQTIGVAGFDSAEVHRMGALFGARGVDRVVPVGTALAFDVIWDGRDLGEELSRWVVSR